jgi:hypothetical protein
MRVGCRDELVRRPGRSVSGGILTYAVELGIIEQNPVHGVRKPKDRVNARRLSEQEYRTLSDILRQAVEDGQYETPQK